jgi:hypothetical protein
MVPHASDRLIGGVVLLARPSCRGAERARLVSGNVQPAERCAPVPGAIEAVEPKPLGGWDKRPPRVPPAPRRERSSSARGTRPRAGETPPGSPDRPTRHRGQARDRAR